MSNITWQTFRDTEFSGFEDTAELWVRYIRDSAEIEEALFSDIEVLSSDDSGDFDGLTADATRAHIRRVSDVFVQDLTDYAERIKQLLYAAGEDFETKRGDLVDLLAEAGTQLVPTGGIGEERFEISTSSPSDFHDTGGTTAAERQEERLRQVERAEAFTEEFRALMAEVRQIDDDLASELRKLDDAAPGLPPTIGTADYSEKTAEYLQELHEDFLDKVESGEATPEEVNKWWNSLSEGDRELFVHELPELVGPVDGIPADDRDTANRNLLNQEIDSFSPTLDEDIAALEAQLEEMRANGEQYIQSGYRGPLTETSEYQELQEQLESLQEEQSQRDNLSSLYDRINKTESGYDYYLLDYDSAEDGKAIVAVGNPDTADNTAVYVPGTGSDLGNFPGAIDRAETMAKDAEGAVGSEEETTVIAWLDYDAPDEVVPNAMDMSYAEDAGPVLSRFTEGLEATHADGSAHTTVVGHSYGTTVVGHTAAEHGVEADKIIAVASPGLDSHSAEELGVGSENVFVTTAEGDAIRTSTDTFTQVVDGLSGLFGGETGPSPDNDGDEWGAWHGSGNPLHDDYGATEFASDATDKDGNPTDDGGDIHSGYWANGNIARENMAYIITDQPEEIISADGYES